MRDGFDLVPNDDPRERRGHWSTVSRPYQNGPCGDEYELPAQPQHLVPHRKIKLQSIGAGIVPTDEEHRQRRKRLGFVGKWWISRNPKHADYHLSALADACESVCNRSRAPILTDETPDVAIPDTIVDFGGLRSTQEQDVGVYTELYSSVGVRKFTSIAKAHFQIGEREPVNDMEIASFEKRAAELLDRAPKSLKTKRGKPYIAKRYWNDDHYPPPYPPRASLSGRCTAVTKGMAPLALAA